MTTEMMLAVFADFNDPKDEPAPLPIEEAPVLFDEVEQIREQAWTDGYLTGRQQPAGDIEDRRLAAKLLTAVHGIDVDVTEAVDAASLVVADLLVNTVVAIADGNWASQLAGRVRLVAERIKPALTVMPEFVLRDEAGAERRFADISALTQALEDGLAAEDVTIRWQRGEALISRTRLLQDLREAVLPLSAGLVNEQNARPRT